MTTSAFESAASGKSVFVSETGIERLQLVARTGHSTFLLGGSKRDGEMTSGPNPYEMLAASLAACTVMTVRLYAERKQLPVKSLSASVIFRRGSKGESDVFERTLVIDSDGLPPEVEKRLREVANMCPVGRTFSKIGEIRDVAPEAPASAPTGIADYMREAAELEIPNVDW